MEKKEELFEKLVNELAAQNKLIALLIAKEMGIDNYSILSDEQQLSRVVQKATSILEEIYKFL